jgi:hypothetical protein
MEKEILQTKIQRIVRRIYYWKRKDIKQNTKLKQNSSNDSGDTCSGDDQESARHTGHMQYKGSDNKMHEDLSEICFRILLKYIANASSNIWVRIDINSCYTSYYTGVNIFLIYKIMSILD